jgi:dipeptidase D
MSQKEIYFEPKRVNDFFVDITTKSRCSYSEDEVRQYVIDQVDDYNDQNPGKKIAIVHYNKAATDPGDRVIVLRKEASPGMEGTPTVILQAHMDMVCVPECNIFPIKLNKYEDEAGNKMLKGGGFDEETGTTLGADDGIGLATALAIITDAENQYGPIECLFTVQEETDMGGARGFDISWLTGKKYINLDSEDYNIITYGSAGGSDVVYEIIPVSQAIPADSTTVSVKLNGLTGGHSGVNINEGSANAIKVMAQLLSRLRRVKKLDVNIAGFEGGSKTNAIPNNATLTITVPSDQYDNFKNDCDEILTAFKQVYQDSDPDFEWSIDTVDNPETVMDTASNHNLTDMLLAIPTGPLKMMSDPTDIVETSTNLAILNADTEKISIQCSNRSSADHSLAALEAIHQAVAKLFGIKMFLQLDVEEPAELLKDDYSIENSGIFILSGRYPAWMPDEGSEFLQTAGEVYHSVYGDNYEANVIHAGLECGWVIKKFGDAGKPIDCIAIGPTIKTPHTWNERLATDTVKTFYDCVTGIMNKIWGQP